MLTNSLGENEISEGIDIEEKAKGICMYPQFRKLFGNIIFCGGLFGKNAPKHSVKLSRIQEGEVCLATNICSNGTVDYKYDIDVNRMYDCLYRTTKTRLISDD